MIWPASCSSWAWAVSKVHLSTRSCGFPAGAPANLASHFDLAMLRRRMHSRMPTSTNPKATVDMGMFDIRFEVVSFGQFCANGRTNMHASIASELPHGGHAVHATCQATHARSP